GGRLRGATPGRRARLARMQTRRRAPGRHTYPLRRRGAPRNLRRRGTAAAPPPQRVPGGVVIEAVIFDLDGVLLDSEQVWDEVREELARERGGRWHEGAQADMRGMSAPGWAGYMDDAMGRGAA